MRAAVVTFPGSNCDRDMAVAIEQVTGTPPHRIWHGDSELPDVDLIALPGGFSYGDYLRCGAMAARSAIIPAVIKAAERGVRVLGVCNGFQLLTEIGLLPGALMRNIDLNFICRNVALTVDNPDTAFTRKFATRTTWLPVAHHDGNYYADDATLDRLEDGGCVAFRYGEPVNGSARNIAGITNAAGTVLGMMPHPERVVDPALGPNPGRPLFESLLESIG